MGGKRYKPRPYIPRSTSNPSGSNESITHVQRVEAAYFSGPIPPPDTLARYNDIVPNGAERLLAMAEKQSTHREELEAQVVRGNISSQRLGSTYAFIISLVAVAGGIWLIHEGKSVTGLAAIIIDLATLAGVFVFSRNKQSQERIRKEDALAKRRNQ